MEQYKEELKQGRTWSRAENDANLLNMIESRIVEIISTEKEFKKKLPKLQSQRLPRFMRRRAASHNVKRLPKKIRSRVHIVIKDNKKLLAYRRKKRFLKKKRILRKHSRHIFKDRMKSLLHKWFAKRFKMSTNASLPHVPIHNHTKNQRNLYRQTRYGCAYLSLAHLICVDLDFDADKPHRVPQILKILNSLTKSNSGFTFCAEALERPEFEITIKFFNKLGEPIGNGMVTLTSYHMDIQKYISIWLPIDIHEQIVSRVQEISDEKKLDIKITVNYPKDKIRIRLIGPDARKKALHIAKDIPKHEKAVKSIDSTFHKSLGLALGQVILDDSFEFVYYYTEPSTVDIVLKEKQGRMAWHKLVKNKAHLVGGLRDWDVLSKTLPFTLE